MVFSVVPTLVQQEGFFDLQEALQAIHMRPATLRAQLAQARSKGDETVSRNIQVTDTVCGASGWEGNAYGQLADACLAHMSHPGTAEFRVLLGSLG